MEQSVQLRKQFETAYDELIEPIFRYLAVRLGDRERARELAQETFMKTWAYAAAGKPIHNMRAFLYTTASNLFKNELRAKREIVSLDTIVEEHHVEPAGNETPPERHAEGTQLMDDLQTLKPEYQEVILLRYVNDLPMVEVARILNISPVTASVRLHRALKALKTIHSP